VTSGTRRRNARGEGARLRDELLDAAARVLAKHGDPDHVSLRNVAAEAGVTAPAIYRHFADRGALLQALAAREFACFDHLIVAGADAGGDDPFDRLASAGRAYLRFGRERPVHYRILFGSVGVPCNETPPDSVQDAGRQSFLTLVDLIGACLSTDGVDPQESRRDRAVDIAFEAWALLHGLVDLPYANRAVPWPDQAAIIAGWVERLRVTTAAPARGR
jgi:AcrR family transcriptional regulator